MKWNNKGHQFDEIGKCFLKRNRIYIYGASDVGQAFYKMLEKAHLSNLVDGFIDRNTEKQKNGFLGLSVKSPDILYETHEEHHIIIVAMLEPHQQQVVSRLIRAGYIENLEFFLSAKFVAKLNEIYLPVYTMYVTNKLIVSSACCIPSNVCNLKCRDCLNFTPYIKQFECRELDEVCQDVDMFFRWIDFTFRFQISGGEPLLYPDLKGLIEYIGINYRDKIDVFETVLNGTIIPSDDVCESMSKYHMTVILDNYTKEIRTDLNHRDEIIQKLEKHCVNWVDNTVDEWFDLDIFHTDNSNMNDKELTAYYDKCSNPWHFYEKGKIYACNFARFATKVGLNEELESGYFDLTGLTEAKKIELLEFLLNYNDLGYVQLCKKCAGWAGCNPNKVPVAVQC